jgi:hypothetical protein
MANAPRPATTGVRSRCAGFCLGLWAVTVFLGGCSALGNAAASRFAANLSAAILDEEDPDLVREGTPAYLILLDALVRSSPEDPQYLGAAAQLYAAYSVAFVTEPERAGTLATKARDYGLRALCASQKPACDLQSLEFVDFAAVVDRIPDRSAEALYSYCVGSLAYIRTHSGDWTAIADLPKVEHALQHLLRNGAATRAANINLYLGILNTLRPEALGGKPELGKSYFEEAIRLTEGRDLSAKVEYARGYARLVYDRELHDLLLNEVLAAPVRQPGLTLFNSLAQREAKALLASANDYF